MKVPVLFLCCCVIGLASVGCRQAQRTDATPAPAATGQAGSSDKADKALANLLIRPDQASRLHRRIQWMQNLQLGDKARCKFIIAQPDLLLFLESDNILTLVEADTGRIRWRQQVDAPITRLFRPARLDDRVVVNSESHAYLFHAKTGKLLNRLDLPAVASTGAVLVGDLAVFGSPTGRVFAVNLRNGLTAWSYQMRGSLLVSPVLVENSTIVVADSLGVVKALSPRGKILWARSAPPWKRISAQPQAGPTAVYVASEDQGLYGIDRVSGNMWHYLADQPLTVPPVVIGERLFQQIGSKGLHCFDAVTGELLWKADLQARPVLMTGQKLLAWQDHRLLVLDGRTGQSLETYDLPKVDRLVTDNPLGGNLYLVNDDGRVLKLSPLP